MIPVYITNYPSKEVSIMWSIESEGNYICPKCRRAALRIGNDLPEHYCIDCDKNSEFYDSDGDLKIMKGLKIW